MLDSGSQIETITEAAADRLGLTRSPAKLIINGVSSDVLVNHRLKLTIYSLNEDYLASSAYFYVMPAAVDNQPNRRIRPDKIHVPAGLKLADNSFIEPAPVDI